MVRFVYPRLLEVEMAMGTRDPITDGYLLY
jgi:hypothetical protein